MSTTKARIKALESRHPGRTGRTIMSMTDKQLARAAGTPWLLACTDDELLEIAKGIEKTNPARFAEIADNASRRPTL
jgi:hypothetical protein